MTNFSKSAQGLATCCLMACCLTTLVFLGMAVPRTGRAQTPPHQNQPDDIYKIRVNTNLVVLHATVEDRKGVSVSGLDKDNFKVYEDGVLQPIKYFSHQDIPVTVGLVIDNSGSMARKRADVIAAALAFARSSNPQDQMFVVNFNEYVSFALPENTPFTDKGSELENALSKIHTAGKTALYDAMAVAMEHLKKGNRDKKVLIVISDGGDNASRLSNLTKVMAMAQRTETIIYTIGLYDEDDVYQNPGVLKQLAQNTGGDVYLPASFKDVVPICERIAHDIRNQYTIAYVPSNTKQNGMFRAIQVKVVSDGRNLLVKTRPGYRAPLEEFSETKKRSQP